MKRTSQVFTPLVLLPLALSACNDRNKRDPLPDWSAGYDRSSIQRLDDAGVPRETTQPALTVSEFALEKPLDVTYPYRLHRTGSDAPCAVSPDKLPKQAGDPVVMNCILDLHELDLWVLGVEFDITVPEGLCDFVELHHYMYQNFAVGEGPTEVAYTIDENGNYTDEVNSFKGQPQCPEFNHSLSASGAPNCCIGTFEETATHLPGGETVTRTGSWLGADKLGDCYGGAGYRLQDVKLTPDGFPPSSIFHLEREAFRRRIVYEGLSEEFPKTNLPLANYFDRADHNNTTPKPLSGLITNPYYEIVCDDNAEEEFVIIRLQVREWNEVKEYAKEDKGDPDTTGMQDTNIPVNDMSDWRDLGQDPAYPRVPRPGLR